MEDQAMDIRRDFETTRKSQKWEYEIIQDADYENLNHYGSQGWELVTLLANEDGETWAYLKRLIEN